MKKIVSIFLTLCMVVGMLPMAAFADQPPGNTSENKPVLLGTETEYASTLSTMFDQYGLRRVSVGFNSSSGTLNKKVGLVNKYGTFVVQPIYDEIALKASDLRLGDGGTTVQPLNFIGGYTQAVRDGKMGLLNTKGEEVVPCQYDFVQMPSEGVCAVYSKKAGDVYYLGYWSLEQNREIVKPNKYVTTSKNRVIGSQDWFREKKPAGDYYMVHDFIGAHAMVFTETNKTAFVKATVIDKNGKEILAKPYTIWSLMMTDRFTNYPQKGPYLAFVEPKNFSSYRFTKLNNEWKGAKFPLTYSNSYATGLVGKKGILIPATYTSGVLSTPGETEFYIDPAIFQIIWDKGLVLTRKDAKVGYLYGGAYGVIDINGKTVVPFTHLVNQELTYYPKENVFKGHINTLYSIKGKKLSGHQFIAVKNGYALGLKVGDFSKERDTYHRSYYLVRTDGAELNINKVLGLDPYNRKIECSDASSSGLIWVRNNQGLWGVINFSGKTVLPFEYEEVNVNSWSEGENGFARVTKNGKIGVVNAKGQLVLPCEYKAPITIAANSPVIKIKTDSGMGLAEVQTGRIILPPQYDDIGAFKKFFQPVNTLFENGVYYAKKSGTHYFFDANGKELFRTTKTFSEATSGLYHFDDNSGYFDNRGRVIIPDELWRSANLEIGASYTVYVKDGSVYRVSANYLDSTYGFKTAAPQKATAAPSSTKLVVNGKTVETAAYTIGGSNYIKLRDLASMVNGTEKNFDVTWDGAKNAVNLLSGRAYTPAGGEMAKGGTANKAATRSDAKIFVDGKEVFITAYTIDGSSYAKLRDVMQIFDISVNWDAATSTATLNTSEGFTPGAYEQAKQDAFQKAYSQASGSPYVAKPTYKSAFVRFNTTPDKILYNVGDPFEIKGFKVTWVDTYARATDITEDIVLKVGSTEIYDGYQFKEAGEKLVDCYYKEEKLNAFKVSVISEDSNLLATGDYYIQLQGKYMYPVAASGIYYMELSDKKPEKPFSVKLIKVDSSRGPLYNITYDGSYIGQPSSRDGAQLQSSSIPHQWRINQYSSFCTIRDYGNQKLLVNAAGQQSKNGTKIIVWKTEGKAPEHSKIQFVKAD